MTVPDPTCDLCPNTPKYRCPKCDARSCSLVCVVRHKEEKQCDGLRDKVKYKHMSKFTDMDLVNDYRLLEQIFSGVDKCRRDKLKRSTRQGTEMIRAPRLQKHLQRLQNQAKSRGMRLRILPPHFVRRKSNTSTFDVREKLIKWHIQLQFPHASKTVELPAVNERTKLWRLLVDFVEFKTADDPSDPFQLYRAVSYGGLSLHLKAEGLPGPGETVRRFHSLDLKRSLKTNLENKAIVEHPIIIVAFKTDDHMYREDQDYIIEDPPDKTETLNVTETVPDEENPVNIDVGDVLGQADAMQADPEAYKHYFDFYLKYYSAKYAQQPPPKGGAPPSPFPCPPPSQGLLGTSYPTLINNLSNNTFPNRSNAVYNPAKGPVQNSNSHRMQGNPRAFSQPPPRSQGYQNPRLNSQGYPHPPLNSRGNQNPQYTDAPQKENINDFPQSRQYNKDKNSVPPPSKEDAMKLNTLQEKQFMSSFQNKTDTKFNELNESNVASAKLIQAELLKAPIESPAPNVLGSLVAYDDSDSD